MRWLPFESAFGRSRREEAADWSQDTHLLAGIWDTLQQANFYYLGAHGVKAEEPSSFPRPNALTPEPRPFVSLAEFSASLKE